jgi:surface antigen
MKRTVTETDSRVEKEAMTVTRKWILVPVVLLALLIAGCETTPGPKATIGGLGGATAGGLIGAAAGGGAAGIAAGVILGGLVGGAIGDRMDAADRRAANEAAARALETVPSGSTTSWRNPDSGNSGSITPTHTYQTAGGQYCREYQQTITVGGQQEKSYGTACRQPDGSWRIVN